jgi:hypothetical protein
VPRALSVRHADVAPERRDEFQRRARRIRTHYVTRGCNYWLFEEDGAPGRFVEFVEAPNRETLVGADAAVPERPDTAAPTYTEIPLS